MQQYEKGVTPTLWELSRAFFLIGVTAYSMAMLEQLKALIVSKRWLTQSEMDEGLAMVQLYPGPIFFNLATYSAYRIKGFSGAFFATFLFVLPSYLLMLLLSWLYFDYGKVAWINPLFIALEAMVVGIVIHVALDFSKRYIIDRKTASLAGISFIFMLFHFNALWIILISTVLGVILFKEQKIEANITPNIKPPKRLRDKLIGLSIGGVIFILLLSLGLFWHSQEGSLLSSMFKVGAVAFGNGMTIMPLLQQEAVISHHWLSIKEFADGIAFGQITPGPFLITATFIGYKVAGITGSLLATVGIFYPSFFYTLVMAEVYEKIKNNPWIKRALEGILSAFSGMLFFVALSLGSVSLVSNLTYIWAIGALILVRYFKLNIIWIFLLGIVAEISLYSLGVSL